MRIVFITKEKKERKIWKEINGKIVSKKIWEKEMNSYLVSQKTFQMPKNRSRVKKMK